jgi:hypothetical protein
VLVHGGQLVQVHNNVHTFSFDVRYLYYSSYAFRRPFTCASLLHAFYRLLISLLHFSFPNFFVLNIIPSKGRIWLLYTIVMRDILYARNFFFFHRLEFMY